MINTLHGSRGARALMHAATQRTGLIDDMSVPVPLVLPLCRSAAARERRPETAGRVGTAPSGAR